MAVAEKKIVRQRLSVLELSEVFGDFPDSMCWIGSTDLLHFETNSSQIHHPSQYYYHKYM